MTTCSVIRHNLLYTCRERMFERRLACMRSLLLHYRVFQLEASRRKWARMIARGWRIFIDLGFGIAALYGFWGWVLHTWFSRPLLWAWSASVLLLLIVFLLVLLRFWQTYHLRILEDARMEWENRGNILYALHDGRAEGIRLIEMCTKGHTNLKKLIENWDDVMDKSLSQIGQELRRAFYEGRKGEPSYMPDDEAEWEQWIRDRNQNLLALIQQFQETPAQLKALLVHGLEKSGRGSS